MHDDFSVRVMRTYQRGEQAAKEEELTRLFPSPQPQNTNQDGRPPPITLFLSGDSQPWAEQHYHEKELLN
eukprot:scaffold2650_cov182-Skeletonema_marinoi.AAC.6